VARAVDRHEREALRDLWGGLARGCVSFVQRPKG
jgi:hypothetical protein